MVCSGGGGWGECGEEGASANDKENESKAEHLCSFLGTKTEYLLRGLFC